MKTFWDRFAFLYDTLQLANRSVEKGIAAAVRGEIKKGMRVMDCAAGTGKYSLAAAENAIHVTCTDFSKEMLICAMKNARKANIRNISFARRDIYSLKDADEKYDAVIAANVMHLLDDPKRAVTELIRVTKKGGKVIIPTFLQGEHTSMKLLLRIYKLAGFDPKSEFSLESYMQFISEAAEENHCKEYSTRLISGILPAGFAVIKK